MVRMISPFFLGVPALFKRVQLRVAHRVVSLGQRRHHGIGQIGQVLRVALGDGFLTL